MLRSWLTRRTSTTLDSFRVLYLSLKRVEHCQAGFERASRPGLEYECVCLRRYSVASADAWHQWHALIHYLSTSWCSPKRSCTPTKYLETRPTSSSWARILSLKLKLAEVNLPVHRKFHGILCSAADQRDNNNHISPSDLID